MTFNLLDEEEVTEKKNHAVLPWVGVEFEEKEKKMEEINLPIYHFFEMFWIKWAAFTSFLSFTTLFYAVKSLFLMIFDATKV